VLCYLFVVCKAKGLSSGIRQRGESLEVDEELRFQINGIVAWLDLKKNLNVYYSTISTPVTVK
jgi:hypothetical protein